MAQKTCFIYIRRSSEKNKVTSVSMDKQLDEGLKLAHNKDYKVLSTFKDNKSRKVEWQRDDFNKMLKEIKDRNIRNIWEKVDHVIIYMASRLARNTKELHLLTNLILDWNLDIISIKENVDCSTLKWKKYIIDLISEAVFENLEKSLEAVRNMNEQYNRGYIPKILPLGYKQNWRWDSRLYEINTDFRISEAVIKIFERYSTWKYSYKSISNRLKTEWYSKWFKKGVEKEIVYFDIRNIETILKRDFYRWKVEVTYKNVINDNIEYLKDNKSVKIKGKDIIVDYSEIFNKLWNYTPLISKKLFDKCKDIREWKKSNNSRTNDTIFPYKNILFCPCQHDKNIDFNNDYKNLRLFTAELKRKNTKSYSYYRCTQNNKTKCDNINTSWEIIEKVLYEKIISKIVFDDIELEILEKVIKNELKEKWIIEDSINTKLKQELWILKKYKDNLLDLYINSNEYVRPQIEDKMKIADEQIRGIENKLIILPDVIEEENQKIKESLYYAKELAKEYLNFPLWKKQAVISSIFKYVIFNKKELIDFELKPLFKGIFNRKVLTSKKKLTNSRTPESNSKNKKEKPSLASQFDNVTYGSPTVNRTQLAGFGVLNSNRWTMELQKKNFWNIFYTFYKA